MLKPLLLTVAAIFVFTACGNPSSSPTPAAAPSTANAAAMPASTPAAAASSPIVQPGTAQMGDRTKCPVSGEEFVVSNDSPKADYEGKTYYFCCASCVDTFKKDPTKYIH